MFLLNLWFLDFIPNINTESIDCDSHVMHILGYAICKKKESEASEEKIQKCACACLRYACTLKMQALSRRSLCSC